MAEDTQSALSDKQPLEHRTDMQQPIKQSATSEPRPKGEDEIGLVPFPLSHSSHSLEGKEEIEKEFPASKVWLWAAKSDLTARGQLRCGNCDNLGHAVQHCTRPTDEYGYINACPLCNTSKHNSVDCPHTTKLGLGDAYNIFVRSRRERPPLRCPWQFWQIDPQRWNHDFSRNLGKPQTADFARERSDADGPQGINEHSADTIWKDGNWPNVIQDRMPLPTGQPGWTMLPLPPRPNPLPPPKEPKTATAASSMETIGTQRNNQQNLVKDDNFGGHPPVHQRPTSEGRFGSPPPMRQRPTGEGRFYDPPPMRQMPTGEDRFGSPPPIRQATGEDSFYNPPRERGRNADARRDSRSHDRRRSRSRESRRRSRSRESHYRSSSHLRSVGLGGDRFLEYLLEAGIRSFLGRSNDRRESPRRRDNRSRSPAHDRSRDDDRRPSSRRRYNRSRSPAHSRERDRRYRERSRSRGRETGRITDREHSRQDADREHPRHGRECVNRSPEGNRSVRGRGEGRARGHGRARRDRRSDRRRGGERR